MFGDNFAEVKTDNLKIKDPMPQNLVYRINEFVRGYENRRLTAEELLFGETHASALVLIGERELMEFFQQDQIYLI